MKSNDVRDIISHHIKFKPARTIIQVLMAGNEILSNRNAQKRCLSLPKKQHIVFSMTFV